MTGDEMHAILKAHAVTQARFADFLGVSAEQANRWRKGGYEIPPYAAVYLRLLQGGHVAFEALETLRRLWESD